MGTDADGSGSGADESAAEPTDEEVVEAASAAAEGLVLSRLATGDVEDLDITVTFEDSTLDVDVYVHAPDADEDVEQVAEDAALAASAAVDDLFAAED